MQPAGSGEYTDNALAEPVGSRLHGFGLVAPRSVRRGHLIEFVAGRCFAVRDQVLIESHSLPSHADPLVSLSPLLRGGRLLVTLRRSFFCQPRARRVAFGGH